MVTRNTTDYLFFGHTHPGNIRENNEDNILICPDHHLWAVADGMGGHAAGEVASRIAIDILQKACSQNESVAHAIDQAHEAIHSAVSAGKGSKGMGSTIVALQNQGSKYAIAWVGDSRAYLWSAQSPRQVKQLTNDHSYVQALLDKNLIRPEEAAAHPERHIITQCLGAQQNKLQVDVVTGTWQPNQWILLCSDGLTNELNDAEIAAVLHANLDGTLLGARRAVDKLIQQALDNGGKDNISVIITKPKSIPTAGIKGLLQRWLN